jgi:hypothetical protein
MGVRDYVNIMHWLSGLLERRRALLLVSWGEQENALCVSVMKQFSLEKEAVIDAAASLHGGDPTTGKSTC